MATRRLTEVVKKGEEPKDSRFEPVSKDCTCGDAEDMRILGGHSPSCPIHGYKAKESRLRGH